MKWTWDPKITLVTFQQHFKITLYLLFEEKKIIGNGTYTLKNLQTQLCETRMQALQCADSEGNRSSSRDDPRSSFLFKEIMDCWWSIAMMQILNICI